MSQIIIGTEEGVQKQRDKARRVQLRRDAAIEALMQHSETRAWMYDLLEFCACYKTTFDRSALQMAFNEGARNVGLRLMAEIMRVTPDGYVQMVREAGATDE